MKYWELVSGTDDCRQMLSLFEEFPVHMPFLCLFPRDGLFEQQKASLLRRGSNVRYITSLCAYITQRILPSRKKPFESLRRREVESVFSTPFCPWVSANPLANSQDLVSFTRARCGQCTGIQMTLSGFEAWPCLGHSTLSSRGINGSRRAVGETQRNAKERGGGGGRGGGITCVRPHPIWDYH